MSKVNDLPENLIARSRRGSLSSSEQLELEQLLASSSTLRVAHRIGLDFDRAAAIQPGDEAHVVRFVAGALRQRRRNRFRFGRPQRVSSWLLAAAVFGTCGAAFGLRGVWIARHAPVPAAHSADLPPSNARVPRKAWVPAANVPEATPLASGAVTPESAVLPESIDTKPAAAKVVTVPPSLPSKQAARTSDLSDLPARFGNAPEPVRMASSASFAPEAPAEPTASALLTQANAARKRGNVEQAIALLREIQQRFGGSAEARLSRVSLGKLLMQNGAPQAALEQFSSYLVSGGPLDEEAIVGRAQALAWLGRTNEERSSWELLMRRFPNSVYTNQARESLELLGNGGTR